MSNNIQQVNINALERANLNFIEAGQKVLSTLQEAYDNPEAHKVLFSSPALDTRFSKPENIPASGCELSKLLEETIKTIFSGYCNLSHPQYYGYISPKPLPMSVIGDLLASGLNQTPGAWRAGPSATVIEAETLLWISQFIGYEHIVDKLPNGIFTSGGAMANASALKLARDTVLGRDVQYDGLVESRFKPSVYVSEEGHFSIWKALDFLGLGRNCLRVVKVHKDGCIDVNILLEQIKKDIKLGYKPICLVGTAGTSATGAVDSLSELAKIARDYDMWFHVDAASGGVFANIPETSTHFIGMNEADSVTIDPCKWLFMSFGIGCLLTKQGSELVKSFQSTSHYFEELSEPDLFQMGLPGTRQWRSLGLWMTFKHLGSAGYQELLRNNLSVTSYLAQRIKNYEELELLQEPILPICSFRVKDSKKQLPLNEINLLIQKSIIEKGMHYPTILDWRGENYFRVCINNFNTNSTHVDALIDTVLNERDLLDKTN